MPVDPLGRFQRAPSSQAINQRIFETSLDLIIVVDKRGTFVRLSPSAHAIIGYDPEELIGRSAAEIVYHEDLDSTREKSMLRNKSCLPLRRCSARSCATCTA